MSQDLYAAQRAVENVVKNDPERLERIRRDHEQRERQVTGLPQAQAEGSTERAQPVLQSEALHGLAGDVVRGLDPYTEADPVATLSNLLAGFGNLAGRGPRAIVLADEHPARLDFVHVGETSKGRKGLAWSPVKKMLQAVDKEWKIASGLSSGEGLIYAVRDSIRERQRKKDHGRDVYQDVEVDPGVADKRLFLIEPEFATVLKALERTGNSLSGILRQAWDGDTLSPLTKGNRISATGAHISIVAHCTAEELTRYLTETERANGLANRFIFLLVKRSKELPDPKPVPDSVLNPLIVRLRAALEFAKGASVIRRDAAAAREWERVYGPLSAGKPGMTGAILNRAEAQVLQLSVAYALLDCSAEIRVEHQRAALALWEYADESVRRIFGDATGNPIADTIMEKLRALGEMDRTQILNLFSRHQPTATIERALKLLELVSKIPEHDFHASESDHPQEILDVVLVARDQAAKHLQPREQALHGPAPPGRRKGQPSWVGWTRLLRCGAITSTPYCSRIC